jgi:hypothetical protein
MRPDGDENNFHRSSHWGITAGYLIGGKKSNNTAPEATTQP